MDIDLSKALTKKFKVDATNNQIHTCSVLLKTIQDAVTNEQPIEPKVNKRTPSTLSLICCSENVLLKLLLSEEALLVIKLLFRTFIRP
ncbi:MAG: hypothetical protein DK302_001218 [Chloroflexi bacterium]|nr:MAG: hypothetical protein DK302_001218 [Chloroflexota bacterium]